MIPEVEQILEEHQIFTDSGLPKICTLCSAFLSLYGRPFRSYHESEGR